MPFLNRFWRKVQIYSDSQAILYEFSMSKTTDKISWNLEFSNRYTVTVTDQASKQWYLSSRYIERNVISNHHVWPYFCDKLTTSVFCYLHIIGQKILCHWFWFKCFLLQPSKSLSNKASFSYQPSKFNGLFSEIFTWLGLADVGEKNSLYKNFYEILILHKKIPTIYFSHKKVALSNRMQCLYTDIIEKVCVVFMCWHYCQTSIQAWRRERRQSFFLIE